MSRIAGALALLIVALTQLGAGGFNNGSGFGGLGGGGSGGGVSSVTGTAPVTSSGGATPAIGVTPMTYWAYFGDIGGSNALGIIANQVQVVGVLIQWPVSVGNIKFNVTTQDNSANLYDVGFYNAGGSLVADAGPASYTTTGAKTAAIVQGTVRLNPGLYWLALTGNGSVLAISAYGTGVLNWTFGGNLNVAASVGGQLPTTITPPAASPFNSFAVPWVALIP